MAHGQIARKIAKAIEEDLCGRRGLRQAFESIDADTQEAIVRDWAALIRKILMKENDND